MKRIQIIAIVVAAVVFMLSYIMFNSNNKQEKTERTRLGAEMEVVVAKVDIGAHVLITEDMLEVKRVLVDDSLKENYFNNIVEAANRISVSEIYAGEPLTHKRALSPDSPYIELAPKITKGKRAIAITTDASNGVGFHIKPGDYVDILTSGNIVRFGETMDRDAKALAGTTFSQNFGANGPANSVVFSETIGDDYTMMPLQDIKVLAVGPSLRYLPDMVTAGYGTVTLEVTPQQALDITFLTMGGASAKLALRSLDDHEIINEPRRSVIQIYEETGANELVPVTP